MRTKRIIAIITVCTLITSMLTYTIAPNINANAEELSNANAEELSVGTTEGYNYANLVVYVNFSDTPQNHSEHITSAWGKCYLEDPDLENLFTSTTYPKSLHQYLYNISYGALNVKSIFPQYDSDANKITPYQLSNNTEYYANYHDLLVRDTIQALNQSGQLSQDETIDLNNDGCIDNLMIVVPCESGNYNELFYGLATEYAGTGYVNSKKVVDYNIIPESGAYLSIGRSGLLIHELLHNAEGYPDLYRTVGGAEYCNPVGQWDIMSSESTYLQYPLAYLRSAMSGWFEIPTVTESQKNYSIYSATAEKKNNQAVILKTPYSDTEFFVVEYRQKSSQYTTENGVQTYNGNSYDRMIYGSGLVIYRVKLDTPYFSNKTTDPYAIYVFRPNDSYNSDGIEKAKGDIDKSFLSEESERTSYGSIDFSKGLEDGAITYSDGTNSGIVISNVGSARGEKITFDITYNKQESKLWKSENESPVSISAGDFCMAEDGSIYYIFNEGSYSNASMRLYRYKDGAWTKLGNVPTGYNHKVTIFKNEIYVAYNDSSFYLNLVKCTNDSTTSIYKSDYTMNDFDICATNDGIYIATEDGDSIKGIIYDGTKNQSLNCVHSSSKYPANAQIAADENGAYVAFREAFNNDKLYLYEYNLVSNAWEKIDDTLNAGIFSIALENNQIYLATNTKTSSDNLQTTRESNEFAATSEEATTASYEGNYKSTVYTYNRASRERTEIGQSSPTESFCDSSISEMTMTVNDGKPYIFYSKSSGNSLTLVVTYEDGKATQVCNNISNAYVDSMGITAHDNKLYINYRDGTMEKMYTKYTELAENDSAKITGHSLYLNGKIGVRFYLKLPTQNSKLTKTTGNQLLEVQELQQYTATINGESVTTEYDENTNTICCSIDTIPALMDEQLELKLIDQDSNVILTDTYSALDYAKDILSPSNKDVYSEELVALVKSIVLYGDTCRAYFCPEKESFADKVLEGEDLTVKEVTGLTNQSKEASGFMNYSKEGEGSTDYITKVSRLSAAANTDNFTYFGQSLRLVSGIDMRYYFSKDQNMDMSKLSVAAQITSDEGSKSAEAIPVSVVEKNQMVYFELAGISAGHLQDEYTITIQYSGKDIYQIKGSPYDYISNAVTNSDCEESLASLCKSLYWYEYCLQEYQKTIG